MNLMEGGSILGTRKEEIAEVIEHLEVLLHRKKMRDYRKKSAKGKKK